MAEILKAPAVRTSDLICSPAGLAEHFDAFLSSHDALARYSRDVQFGPYVVTVTFHGFAADAHYAHALRPAAPGRSTAFTIDVIDGAGCDLPQPRLAWQPADFGPRWIVPGWSDHDHATFLLPIEEGLAIADWIRNRATIWLPSSRAVPWYERAAPFRWLFGMLATRLQMTTLHAAVIGRDGVGVLIAGRGGSGKSTLALAGLGRGLDYVSDDYCLLSSEGSPCAYALYSTAKWKKNAAVSPDWLAHLSPAAIDTEQQKYVIFLDVAKPDQLVARLPIAAIVVPTIADVSEPRLDRIAPQEALRSLAASTIAQSQADGTAVLHQIGRLVRAVPAYRLHMPRDLDASVSAIESLLEREASSQHGRERCQ